MAYIRKRTTSSGNLSTTLVESYRDQGRPRQRVLANLYGCTDLPGALAKLAVRRKQLREELDELRPQVEEAEEFYKVVMNNTLAGHKYSARQRREIDGLLRERERLLKRVDEIEKALDGIQKNGVVIKRHCTATDEEIQAAIETYQAELKDAEAAVMGMELMQLDIQKAKNDLRRLSLAPAPPDTRAIKAYAEYAKNRGDL